MAGVPTVNILMTFSKSVADNILQGKETLASLLVQSKKNKDILLFNNLDNNFVQMTHDFMFDGGAGDSAGAPNISVEILDPQNIFEARYLANSMRSILNLDQKLDLEDIEEARRLKGILEEAKNRDIMEVVYGDRLPEDIRLEKAKYESNNNYIKQFKELADRQDIYDAPLVPILGETSLLETIFPLGFEVIRDNVGRMEEENKEYLSKWKTNNEEIVKSIEQKISELTAEPPRSSVYIMYGMGDDLSSWAGPFLTVLYGTKYNFSAATGSKSIVLSLTPVGNWAGLTPFKLDKRGLGTYVEGREEILRYDFTSKDNITYDAIAGSRSFTPAKFKDHHKSFINCLSQYLHNCVGRKANIIILMPNLNKLYEVFLESYRKSYENITGRGVSSKLPGDAIATELYAVSKMYSDLGLDVRWDTVGRDFTGAVVIDKTKFQASYENPYYCDARQPTQRRLTPDGKRIPEGSVKSSDIGIKGAAFKGTTTIDIAIVKMAEDSFMAPLHRIEASMNDNKYSLEPKLRVIDDYSFIRALAKYVDNYKFGPDEVPFTIDPKKPILLYGGENLTQKFFYGKRYLEDVGLFSYTVIGDKSNTTKQISNRDLLAPQDRIFATDEYLEICKKYFFTEIRDKVFNFSTLPKGTFAILPEAELLIKKSNIPIFKFGVQESNILDLNFDINSAYFAALNSLAYRDDFMNRKHTGAESIDSQDTTNPYHEMNRDSILTSLKDYLIISPEGKKGLSQELKSRLKKDTNLSESDFETMADFIAACITSESKAKTQYKSVSWWGNGDPFNIILGIINTMTKVGLKGTVKTLPAFYLSKTPDALPPVLMFITENNVLPKRGNDSISKLLTGLWMIYGYQHRISGGECSSSFHLIKSLAIEPSTLLIPEITNKEAFSLNN